MKKLNWIPFITCILILVAAGSMVSGQCVSDGNDTAADASPIGLSQTVSDWVCPDDPLDYYLGIGDGPEDRPCMRNLKVPIGSRLQTGNTHR